MAETDHECKSMIESTREEILSLVGELYFGDGETYEQYHAIDDLLCERGENLMVVELGRAAPLGHWFASLGETPSFRGGLSLAVTDDLLHITGCARCTRRLAGTQTLVSHRLDLDGRRIPGARLPR